MSDTTFVGIPLANPPAPPWSPEAFIELRGIQRPYPGLRPFEAWESAIFFGRERHTERLTEILGKRRFLAVIGPSGSGKSSLVRAGLLPELPRGRLGTGTRWRVADMTPGQEPMRNLARALLQAHALGGVLLEPGTAAPMSGEQTMEGALLEAELWRGPRGLVDIALGAARQQVELDAAAHASQRPPVNLLLLVDQFEELFTHSAPADEVDAFVKLLLVARDDPNARLHVALTMRTDFLGACVRLLDLPDAINRAQYLVPRLTPEETALAITEPARRFDGNVDSAVVQELINAAGSDPDQLPILQHAMSRMWELAVDRAGGGSPSIGFQEFKDVGGVGDALNQHAEAVLATLGSGSEVPQKLEPTQVIARDLLCAITEQRSQELGGQMVRQPKSLDVIATQTGRKPEDFSPVLSAFGSESVNFIRLPANPAGLVNISHEALIRNWPRLRSWVTGEARRGTEYRRLRRQAIAWRDREVGSGQLTGATLARAEEWLKGSSVAADDGWRATAAWASRYSRSDTPEAMQQEFDDVCAYVVASTAAANAAAETERDSQRQRLEAEANVALLHEQGIRIRAERRLRRVLAGAFVVALGLAAFGLMQSFSAERARRELVGHSLWIPLDLESRILKPKEADALLHVVRADADTLADFTDRLLYEEAYAARFLRAPASLLTAMVGPNPAARRLLVERLSAASLKGQPPTGSARALSHALLNLMLADPAVNADDLARPVVTAASSFSPGERDLWRTLGGGLAEIAPELDSERRHALFKQLTEAVASTPRSQQRLALAIAAGSLVGVASREEKTALFDILLDVSQGISDEDVRRDSPMSLLSPTDSAFDGRTRKDALMIMLRKLSGDMAQAAIMSRWTRVMDLISGESARDTPRAADAAASEADRARQGFERRELVSLLSHLNKRLPDDAAVQCFGKAVELVVQADRKGRNSRDSLSDQLRTTLLDMAKRVPPTGLDEAAQRILTILADADLNLTPASRTLLINVLEVLVPGLDSQGLERVATAPAMKKSHRFGANGIATENAVAKERKAWTALWSKMRGASEPIARRHAPAWVLAEWKKDAEGARDVGDESSEGRKVRPAPTHPLSADTSGAINVLLKTIADEHDTDVLNRMGVDLGRLVGQLSESQLLPAARAIIAVWMGAFDFDQQKVMGDQFGVLVRRLQWSDRDELRRMAVEQLRLEASSASAAGSAYRLLTQDVDAGQAAIIVQELLGFIDGNQPSVRIAISEMRRMVGLLDKEEKFKVAKSLASILSRLADMSSVSQTSSRIPPRSQSTSIDQVAGSLALALNVAVVGSPEERRGELADSLIVSLSETRLPAAAAALGSVLAVVPGDGLPRPAYISRLSAALSATKKSQVVTALTGAILRVVSLQPPDDATAAAYVEVMRYPARSREAAVAFREQFKGAPSADRGYWALIGWMQARWPQLPLTERPKEPA